jgi:drug/metabolite transporter (DMT)-like permease
VHRKPHNGALAGSLLVSVCLFGASNTGITFLVRYWPPVAVGATRFLIAGLSLILILRWTRLFGTPHKITPELNRRLWLGPGLMMGLYIIVFNYALKLTSVSHVAVYLGAAPVWALLWEGKPEKNWKTVQRYAAAALAFSGVLVLSLPVLKSNSARLSGEILGLLSSVIWTNVGRKSRTVGQELSGPEISAHTFWRAGLLVTPVALLEFASGKTMHWRADLVWIQVFCIFGGGVTAFALWNNALRHWKTSQVYLFNNLVPISTMTWAHFCLHEPFTRTFWAAMALVGSGVLLGQANLQGIFGARWLPTE